MNKKTNKEKFMEMNTKQKVEYIWEYYRWHIVGVIVGIFAIWQVFVIINKPPEPVYSTDIIVSGLISMDDEKSEQTLDKFRTEFDTNIQFMPANWKVMDQSTMSTETLLALKIAVKEVDMFILAEEKFDKYQLIEGYDAMLPLDTIPELEGILEKYQDRLISFTSKDDGKEHVFGIKVDSLDKIEGLALGEELVISILGQPKNLESTIQVLTYLLK